MQEMKETAERNNAVLDNCTQQAQFVMERGATMRQRLEAATGRNLTEGKRGTSMRSVR